MRVRRSDEQDSGWEDPRPTFRVYLHGSDERSTAGSTDTYDITGADVLQVVDWAQRQAGDRLTYAIALVREGTELQRREPGHDRGLVWLLGVDGNDATEEGSPERRVQERMLSRRQAAVGIPAADRAPSESA